MHQLNRRTCKKALVVFLSAAITLQATTVATATRASAAEPEQDYIIVFDDAETCQDFAEEAQTPETNPEGESLLKMPTWR